MYDLKDIFEAVEQIDDVDKLKELELSLKDSNYTKAFWQFRKEALSGETELVRRRARIKCRAIAKAYNAAIPVNKRVGRFSTPHGFAGIHISAFARVGKGCTIFQHVTIGSNTLPDSKNQGFPTIGDNVFIGAGAMIIGNVIVGDNARIGANAIVTKDVPPNSVVVLSGQKVTAKEEILQNKFIPVEMYKKQIDKNQDF